MKDASCKVLPLWLTWEKQVRNRNLSARVGARLVEINRPGGKLRRYALCTAKTYAALRHCRNGLVFVQNPSLLLVIEAIVMRKFLHYTLVMDAHNAGIFPAEGRRAWLQRLADWATRRVDLVLVTNDGLAGRVRRNGGIPFVLPDPLPIFFSEARPQMQVAPESEHTALFVCTWAADEPYLEVLAAAEKLPNIRFVITGNSRGRERKFGRRVPRNVCLVGYLPDKAYERALFDCSFVIDLTTRDDCLVCGAYEAVSAEKPFVLSDSVALRRYFRDGGVYVENRAEAIVDGIRLLLSDYLRYTDNVSRLRPELISEWELRYRQLQVVLDERRRARALF